jgi:tyrosyl-tRNA synthetase
MILVLHQEVPSGRLEVDPGGVVDALVTSGACKSKGEARRLIRGGGVSLNGRKVETEDASLSNEDFLDGRFLFFRLGKKRFHIAERPGF